MQGLSLKSVLKPESSVAIGLGEAALVYVIYQNALPPMVDIRTADPHDRDVEGSRKAAAWKSAIMIGVVWAFTRDTNALLIGGAAMAGMDLMVKHANGVNPSTGKLAGSGGDAGVLSGGMAADNDVAYPLPDYGDDEGAGADGGY